MNPIRERTELLIKAREIVSASLDVERALTDLAEFLAPTLADWCVVDLVEDGATVSRVVVAHADPARLPLAQALKGRFPMSHEASHGPVKAIRTGRTLLARKTDDAGVIALTGGADHRAILGALGVRSVICTPLVGRHGPVGALTLVRAERHREFTASDAAVARVLGTSAGTAVVHGRLYRDVQAASEAKDRFMATLGHELRNPIGAIMNAVSVLERLGTPDEPAARVRTIILRQVEHLGRLVDDLLDVARLTSGKIALKRQPVDLRDVVERCLATLRLPGGAEGHDLQIDVESATVSGDPTRLEQVLGNLLDNAVKYTPPGGRIAVTVRRDGDLAVLRVQDTGMGIAAEVLPRLFELFAQAPQTLDRPGGGLGLGLALVRRLVGLHGGSVEAESPGVGRGTTVTVRLPLTPAEKDTDAARGTDARPAVPSRRVLIIEDHADACDALRQLLEMDGHQVEVSGEGRLGIDLARRFRPDLVLIDIGLPGMSGYEVARKLRGEGQDVWLVALTGYGQAADRAQAREAGFDAHLVKPVDPDRLARLIAEAGPRRPDAA